MWKILTSLSLAYAVLLQCCNARSILQGGMPIVQGSGSTAAAVVWRSVIANATYTGNAPLSLTYDAVGSGQGLKNLINQAYDYAVSDVPIPLATFNSLNRPILQVPFALSAFDAIHSVSGLRETLRLNPHTLAGIWQCTITRWNDPAIAALNPGNQLPAVDINPVVRVDGSGSTQLLTQYLAQDPAWQLGVGTQVVWPKCTQQVQGSAGVISYIASTPNAVGYGEYGLALGQNLGLAALQNSAGNFVRPDQVFLQNITEVFGSDLAIPSSLNSADWANVSLATKLPLAYPVTGIEYIFLDANLTGKSYQQASILQELVQYMLSDAVQLTLPFWTFAALPEKIRLLAQHDVGKIPLPPRPANADTMGWPNVWINVYGNYGASRVVASNATST